VPALRLMTADWNALLAMMRTAKVDSPNSSE